jgi:hypothetical protein
MKRTLQCLEDKINRAEEQPEHAAEENTTFARIHALNR